MCRPGRRQTSSAEQRLSRVGRMPVKKEPSPTSQSGGTPEAKRPPRKNCLSHQGQRATNKGLPKGNFQGQGVTKRLTNMEQQRATNRLVATKKLGRTYPRETAKTKEPSPKSCQREVAKAKKPPRLGTHRDHHQEPGTADAPWPRPSPGA